MIRNSASKLKGVLLTVALLVVAGCSAMPELAETTAEDSYGIGIEAAERGDYLLAIEAFKRVTINSPLHDMADDSLVGLADAHRAISDHASAEAEYRELLSDYPHSSLVPEAEYKLGLTFLEQALPAALDQTMTKQAISQFEYFLAAYPTSGFTDEARAKILELRTRLAAKRYESAALYFDLGKPKAARVYLEAVVSEYEDTVWARVALLEKARSLSAEGSQALAEGEYRRIIELYPGTEEALTAAEEVAALGG